MKQIKALLEKKEHVIVAIDGRASAGKSTLADNLASEYGGAIICMDHFFLPPDLRKIDRINVHYERFLEEVVPNIKNRIPFTYRIFDCSQMDYSGVKNIEMKPLIIVEGAYTHLPYWEEIFDLKIFCDIDKDEQKSRIINRNGLDAYQVFKEKWIPLEEEYIRKYSIMKKCDLIILKHNNPDFCKQ